MDRCKTCLWFKETEDEDLREFIGKDGLCWAFPSSIPKDKNDFCGLHRPRRTGWELRIGSLLFRFEYKRVG